MSNGVVRVLAVEVNPDPIGDSAGAAGPSPRRRRWPVKQAVQGIRDSEQALQHVLARPKTFYYSYHFKS
jgi:hypothetical protein